MTFFGMSPRRYVPWEIVEWGLDQALSSNRRNQDVGYRFLTALLNDGHLRPMDRELVELTLEEITRP